jgi:hypothetical protein
VAWLQEQVSAESNVEGVSAQALHQMYLRERDHLVRVAKTAIDAGVAEREVRLAENQGQLIAYAVMKMIDGLDLTAQQHQRARQLVSEHLRELSAAPSPA